MQHNDKYGEYRVGISQPAKNERDIALNIKLINPAYKQELATLITRQAHIIGIVPNSKANSIK